MSSFFLWSFPVAHCLTPCPIHNQLPFLSPPLLPWYYCSMVTWLWLTNRFISRSSSVPGSIPGNGDGPLVPMPSFKVGRSFWLHHLHRLAGLEPVLSLWLHSLLSFSFFLSLPLVTGPVFAASASLHPPVPLHPSQFRGPEAHCSHMQPLPISWNSSSQVCSAETLSGYVQGQNYFPNSTNMLFVVAKQQWVKLLVP